MPMPSEPSFDENKLKLLDEYLAELQAGRQPDMERWIAENPQLAPLLECLNSLENLAAHSELVKSDDEEIVPFSPVE